MVRMRSVAAEPLLMDVGLELSGRAITSWRREDPRSCKQVRLLPAPLGSEDNVCPEPPCSCRTWAGKVHGARRTGVSTAARSSIIYQQGS